MTLTRRGRRSRNARRRRPILLVEPLENRCVMSSGALAISPYRVTLDADGPILIDVSAAHTNTRLALFNSQDQVITQSAAGSRADSDNANLKDGVYYLQVDDPSGHGMLELVVANANTDQPTVLKGSGDDAFAFDTTLSPALRSFGALEADSRLDLVVSDPPGAGVWLFVGLEEGNQILAVSLALTSTPAGLAVAGGASWGRDFVLKDGSPNDAASVWVVNSAVVAPPAVAIIAVPVTGSGTVLGASSTPFQTFYVLPTRSLGSLASTLLTTGLTQVSEILPLAEGDLASVAVILVVSTMNDIDAFESSSVSDQTIVPTLARSSPNPSALEQYLAGTANPHWEPPPDLVLMVPQPFDFGIDWVWSAADTAAVALEPSLTPRQDEPVALSSTRARDVDLVGPEPEPEPFAGEIDPDQIEESLTLSLLTVLLPTMSAAILALVALIRPTRDSRANCGPRVSSHVPAPKLLNRSQSPRGRSKSGIRSGRPRSVQDLPPWISSQQIVAQSPSRSR